MIFYELEAHDGTIIQVATSHYDVLTNPTRYKRISLVRYVDAEYEAKVDRIEVYNRRYQGRDDN